LSSASLPDPDSLPDPAHWAGPVPTPRLFLGRVTSFDARRGLGTVTVNAADGAAADGDADAEAEAYDFHATAIADGSRRIDPGTEVSFVVRPGHRGRYEAFALTVVDGMASHHLPA
jgi:cold shock CspA family protein